MSEPPPIAVSPRAIYHMRQEIVRLLDAERAARGAEVPPAELERLARAWMAKYRTLRPAAACRLVERLATEPAPEPGRFAVFVLAGLARRYADALWPDLVHLHSTLRDRALARLLARRVAAPLLEGRASPLASMEASGEAPDARAALLLAEAARALQVTAPELVARVEAVLSRD